MLLLRTMFVLVIFPYITSAQNKSSKVFLYTVSGETFGIYTLTFSSFNNVDIWINCICGNKASCAAATIQLSSETPSVKQSEPADCNLIDFKGDNVTYHAQTPVNCLRNHTQKVIPYKKPAICNPQCVILAWFADGDRSSFNPLNYCKTTPSYVTEDRPSVKILTEPIYVTTTKTFPEPIYVTTTPASTTSGDTVAQNSKTELIVAVTLSVGCTILVVFAVIIIIVCVKRKRRGRMISSKTSKTEKITTEAQYSSLDANYSGGHTYAGVTTTPVYSNASDVTKFKNMNPSPKGNQRNKQTKPKMLLRDESIASEDSHAYNSPLTSGDYTNIYDGIDEDLRDSQGVYRNTEPAAFYYSQAGGTKGPGHEYLKILPPIDDYTETNKA